MFPHAISLRLVSWNESHLHRRALRRCLGLRRRGAPGRPVVGFGPDDPRRFSADYQNERSQTSRVMLTCMPSASNLNVVATFDGRARSLAASSGGRLSSRMCCAYAVEACHCDESGCIRTPSLRFCTFRSSMCEKAICRNFGIDVCRMISLLEGLPVEARRQRLSSLAPSSGCGNGGPATASCLNALAQVR